VPRIEVGSMERESRVPALPGALQGWFDGFAASVNNTTANRAKSQ
jgi:hypothetical protein